MISKEMEYTKARLLDAIEMIDNEEHIESIISMVKSGLGELKDYNDKINGRTIDYSEYATIQ